MNIYEQSMVKALGITNYQGEKEEKIALRDVASEVALATDFTFGENVESKTNFTKIYNALLGLSPEDLQLNGIALAKRLFNINSEFLSDYGKVRIWYENNKENFDKAYQLVFNYMQEKNPDIAPQAR